MEFKYIKPLDNKNLISEFENEAEHKFSNNFVVFVMKNNGSRPSNSVFYSNQNQERVMKSFLSFNKQDRETIWKMWNASNNDFKVKMIPFAIDHFGNLICFDKNNAVVFYDHETETIEFVANDFDEFMNSLKQ